MLFSPELNNFVNAGLVTIHLIIFNEVIIQFIEILTSCFSIKISGLLILAVLNYRKCAKKQPPYLLLDAFNIGSIWISPHPLVVV